MQTLELFCGTKSFSKVAGSFGYATFTVDCEAEHEPELVADILLLSAGQLPQSPYVLWASPPCQTFSVASLRHYWNKDGTPKTLIGHRLVAKTLSIIIELKPAWWFIENPRAMLRAVPWFEAAIRDLEGVRRTVTYCKYGADVFKPTDIWTNARSWRPQALCSNDNPCPTLRDGKPHTGIQSGRRGALVKGLTSAKERARIPSALFTEIFNHLKKETANDNG